MKRIVFLICLFSVVFASSQNQKNVNLSDKIFYGGGLGLSFGNITNIEISPLIGYRITDDFHTGLQFRYQYIDADYFYYGYHYDFRTSIYGIAPFLRYFIMEEYFLISEFEFLSLETKHFDVLGLYDNFDNRERFIYHSFLVGAGYAQNLGGSSIMYFSLLYNLNDSSNSPYSSPWVVRVGVNF